MMGEYDLIFIAQSQVVHYEEYSQLPLDRLDLYREIVYPRMVRYQDRFLSHLDLINVSQTGRAYQDAAPAERQGLLDIWNLPALSGMHLACYLSAYDLHTGIINHFDAEWDRFRAMYAASARKPLVAISTTFHLSWSEVRRITRQLREFDPEMQIVLGGAFVNSLTLHSDDTVFEHPMQRYKIDYILHAQNSESDLRDLLRARRGEIPLDAVANLVAYQPQATPAFHVSARAWHPPVLNDLPATWHQLDLPFFRHTAQLRTSCGCPFACAFCSYPVVGHGFNLMDIAAVERMLGSVTQIPGLQHIIFVDDTFNVPKQRFVELCKLFSQFDFTWFSFLRAQFIDAETAALMRDSGCEAVYLGLESANDTVLRNMNKRATRDEYLRGIAHLKQAGITLMAAFVLGFPGETAKTIAENIDFIEQSGVDFYTLKEFYYLEHTRVHTERDLWSLTGMGNKWSHATMTSDAAYQHKIDIFRAVKNATFIDPDMSLWYLALLRDAGFSYDRIHQVQAIINQIMREQMANHFENDIAFQALRCALSPIQEAL